MKILLPFIFVIAGLFLPSLASATDEEYSSTIFIRKFDKEINTILMGIARKSEPEKSLSTRERLMAIISDNGFVWIQK